MLSLDVVVYDVIDNLSQDLCASDDPLQNIQLWVGNRKQEGEKKPFVGRGQSKFFDKAL
jgi:hypothetical protein